MTVEDSLCRQVAAAIAKVCARAPGIGRWDRAWELVEGPDAHFLAALATYSSGGERQRKLVEHLGNQAVLAWKKAVKEWQATRAAA